MSEGLVVAGVADAAAGLELLRRRGVDRAELVIAARSTPAGASPPIGVPLRTAIIGQDDVSAAVAGLLADFVLVGDLSEAVELVSAGGPWVAVTADGDVLGPAWARGGVRDGSTRWDMRDAIDQARQAAEAAAAQVLDAQAGLQAALAGEQEAGEAVERARTLWQDERTRQAARSERTTQWTRRLEAASQSVVAGQRRVAALQATVAADRDELGSANQALQAAQEALAALPEPDGQAEPELSSRLGELRQAETEARLALRTTEERAASLAQRAASLERAAHQERLDRDRAAQQHRVRIRRAETAAAVAELATAAREQAEQDLAAVTQQRQQLRADAAQRASLMAALRTGIRDLEAEVARLTDSVHRDEVARAEQRLRIEQIAERALSEHGISTDVLVAEYGPDVLIPPSPAAPGDGEDGPPSDTEPYRYDRQAQERRLRSAQRSLALLGTVNPLALEEFAAAEERYTYLVEQIEDMKRTRADLLGIIQDVDARVEQVFAEAFADTAEQFERVFARLFPGGEGRLILTEPGDLLTTGVDVEARPPGKKIKRLSLLSGGERSLTAVAFLIALFKARPSPFYVLDEVEAALDDTNLGRLIEVIEELRSSSQLIVITHQKRTMEAADALYGVTMRGDGMTQVISQRLAEREPAGAPAVIDLTAPE